MTYLPCKLKDCDHQLQPERPERVTGPLAGELYIYQDPRYPLWHNTVVRVRSRSYVWSPELHMANGYHGYRHYDWSVIETDERGGSMVVGDDELVPLKLGTRVADNETEVLVG